MSADRAPDFDVVVVGAGMAGLTIAATLAQAGRTVAVLEASDEVGGSARLSEGYVWTAPSDEVFLAEDPGGSLARFRLLRAALEPAFSWLEANSVAVGEPLRDVLGFGQGRQIDIAAFLARCVTIVESSGGYVLRATEPSALATDGEAVVGVVVDDGDGAQTLRARAVVIATGGYQAESELRGEWMGAAARELVVRSNPRSRGDGIRLGTGVGADLDGPADGFYGHLVPVPLDRFDPPDFAALAQYYSDHGILVDRSGARFTDESLGDHVNTIEVARRGRAVLIVDERIRRTEATRAFIPGMDAIDKIALAASRGARTAEAGTLGELADRLDAWGFDGARAAATVAGYSRAIVAGEPTDPPRTRHRRPMDDAPYSAIEVQAAMTFTYRGLAGDDEGRVTRDGVPIPGLYAAGADLGAVNVRGYTGGLVRGLALGRVTAAAILADLVHNEEER